MGGGRWRWRSILWGLFGSMGRRWGWREWRPLPSRHLISGSSSLGWGAYIAVNPEARRRRAARRGAFRGNLPHRGSLMRPLRAFWFAAATFLWMTAAGTQALAQFETRASASTGAYRPISVAVGDFNRDGKLDVAVVNYLPSGNVMVFLGNGDGTFRAGSSYDVAVQPLYASAASLRHNGILDLVVGDSLSDYVYVMLGNGDGTFQPAVAYPASGRPSVVSTGDFRGAGQIDIVALAQSDCNCVAVLPGNGDGTFGAAVITPVPYNVTWFGMAPGDFGGDGKLDVAATGGFGSANQVEILLGNGDGSFRAYGYYPVSLAPYSVVAGRFHGNKTIDLAVGNFEGGSISVLLGNGDGTFQAAVD